MRIARRPGAHDVSKASGSTSRRHRPSPIGARRLEPATYTACSPSSDALRAHARPDARYQPGGLFNVKRAVRSLPGDGLVKSDALPPGLYVSVTCARPPHNRETLDVHYKDEHRGGADMTVREALAFLRRVPVIKSKSRPSTTSASTTFASASRDDLVG